MFRERDTTRDSKWLPWWNELHPPPAAERGGSHVGAGTVCAPEPWAAERGDEPVFVKHTYDCFLREEDSSFTFAFCKRPPWF